MRIAIDGGGYRSACDGFYDANHGVIDTLAPFAGTLDGGAGMAGSDTGGSAWADQYDPAATKALRTGCDLGAAIGTMANLLNASLVNHDAADGGARLTGPPELTGQSSGDHDPSHGTEQLFAADPPSSHGGTGDVPGWWHWIASHLEGLFWPDADTGRLRSIGGAWISTGNALDAYVSDLDAATALVSSQTAPEIHDAVSACREVRGHLGGLAQGYRDIGRACQDYAQHVDDHHRQIEDELASFIEWTIAIEAGGAILGALTFGAGEGLAQAGEAAEVANAASKVRRILTALIELARTVATTVGRVLTRISEIASKLTKFLSAPIERALVRLGVKEADAELPELLTNARQLQKKFKHAADFGVEGNYNPANAAAFEQKIREFLGAPGTTRITGTYRGDPAVLSYSPTTSQVVVQDASGNFVSAWKMTPAQLQHVIESGSLGGG
jgi:hypothetical protein